MTYGREQIDSSFRRRRRGTAIVETEDGILVNAMLRGPYILPGGATHRRETRLRAAIRELEEETHLRALAAVELFEYIGKPNRLFRYQDHHKVVYIVATGTARRGGEVAYIDWYRDGSSLNVSGESVRVVSLYREFRRANPGIFDAMDGLRKTLATE